jgi:hypothetical protein
MGRLITLRLLRWTGWLPAELKLRAASPLPSKSFMRLGPPQCPRRYHPPVATRPAVTPISSSAATTDAAALLLWRANVLCLCRRLSAAIRLTCAWPLATRAFGRTTGQASPKSEQNAGCARCPQGSKKMVNGCLMARYARFPMRFGGHYAERGRHR